MRYRRLDLNLLVGDDGPQCNTLQKRGGDQVIRDEGFATQVWARGAQGWQISSFHATRAAA